MRQKSMPGKEPATQVVKNIRRATRRHFSAEDKIRIVLEGLRGEDSIAELCRREGFRGSARHAGGTAFGRVWSGVGMGCQSASSPSTLVLAQSSQVWSHHASLVERVRLRAGPAVWSSVSWLSRNFMAGRVILRPRLARLTLARALMDLPGSLLYPTKCSARIAATFRCFGMTAPSTQTRVAQLSRARAVKLPPNSAYKSNGQKHPPCPVERDDIDHHINEHVREGHPEQRTAKLRHSRWHERTRQPRAQLSARLP